MTEQLEKIFTGSLNQNKKVFIPYIMAGDPEIPKTLAYIDALIRAGADIIELGMPFSDPIADGPVIQKAAQRALQSGTNIPKIFELVSTIKKSFNTPIVLMGYINPVLKYGVKSFFKDAKDHGVDGVILPDMPLEESSNVKPYAEKYSIDVILLAAPTSNKQRLLELSRCTGSFLYYISVTGVTGLSKQISNKVFNNIKWLKKHTKKPVVIGFGISTPEQAKNIAKFADGIVVGSAFVRLIEEHTDASEYIYTLAHQIKSAIDI
jgi:tryptophan synthase alpha chain